MRRANAPFLVAVLAALQLGAGGNSAEAQPAATYAALKDLPDFAGSWTPLGPPFVLAPARPGAAPVAPPISDGPKKIKKRVVSPTHEEDLKTLPPVF